MPSWTIKEGDTLPVFDDTLTYDNGDGTTSLVDLSSASVLFVMRSLTSRSPTVSATASVVGDPTLGNVEYIPTVVDTATPGEYVASWVVTFPTGTQTFPTEGYNTVSIEEQISTAVGGYVTPTELADYMGATAFTNLTLSETACIVASRTVETMCDRVFLDSGTPSARYYEPESAWCVELDDFSTTTGLIVQTDTGYDGTYTTTLTLNTDYIVQPRNQLRSGQPWPYSRLELVGTTYIGFPAPAYGRHDTVAVTAQWGWATIPDAVKHACLVGAARLFKLKDSPDGFIGMDGWGPVKVKENPEVRALLSPYMRSPVTVV